MKNLKLILMGLCVTLLSLSPAVHAISDSGFPTQKPITLNFQYFEKTAEEIQTVTKETLEWANQELLRLANTPYGHLTFENSVRAFERVYDQVDAMLNRFDFLGAVSKNKALREMVQKQSMLIQEWLIDLNTRKDIYLVLKAYSDQKPAIGDEERRLLERYLQDYERMGFNLPLEEQEKVKSMMKELAGLENDADNNIKKSTNNPIYLTQEEVAGTPQEILDTLEKDENGRYVLRAGIVNGIQKITQNCPVEATRKKVVLERNIRAPENTELAKKIMLKRAEIAKALGYKTWADYKTAPKMIQNGQRAIDFIEDMSKKIDVKFQNELDELKKIKARDTGTPLAETTINTWDIDYFKRIYLEEKFNMNMEDLRKYFKIENVLQGLFTVYEKSFGIKFEYIDVPYVWDNKVKAIKITDSKSGELQGVLYMDLFPRPQDDKYNHFAMFSIRPGRLMEDGSYRHAVASLVCNFPEPKPGKPSLLTFDHVTTLFHEFGHGLHEILSKAKYSSLAGVRVAGDFVESPSQVLEYWVYNKNVLDLFAVNYQDPTDHIPQEIINGIVQGESATIGIHYKRQFAFALGDLRMHSIEAGQEIDPVQKLEDTIAEVYLANPEGAKMLNSFGHLFHGYDAGYYGYAWADNIAADFASIFEAADGGFLNEEIGMRLRKEVFEAGATRDENVSAKAFLKRDLSNEAFVNKLLGI